MRDRVVAIAKSWLRTPYHHQGRIKGGGCDCLTLLAEVYTEADLIERPQLPNYSAQWHMHRGAELYIDGLTKYAHEITDPLPGDIVLWKFGRTYSHGAIVVQWPHIIHSYIGQGCVLENAETAKWLNMVGENTPDKGKIRPRRFFSYWSD